MNALRIELLKSAWAHSFQKELPSKKKREREIERESTAIAVAENYSYKGLRQAVPNK